MTSFGKHAYLHVYSNSHTTYQINPFFFVEHESIIAAARGCFQW